jgi:beta-lactamase class A
MKSKVSITTLVISCILVFVSTYAISKLKNNGIQENLTTSIPIQVDCNNEVVKTRLKNFELIQPLLYTDVYSESSSLLGLRSKIDQYVNTVKNSQSADEISVYFRKMNNGDWFCINPNKTYNPASMSKLIQLITFLKEAEDNPSILNRKIFFSQHFSQVSQQNIKDFSLKEHSYYSISDLLIYMIKYSDNDATILLNLNINKRLYKQLFTDLNIPVPPESGEYFITAMDFSKFFRILYNGTYLRPEYSEYALKLLTLSTFKDGLKKDLDSSVVIAHKFGERIIGNKAQFHEFGIIYIKGDPYLLGVMTEGSSLSELSGIISEISRITYSEFNRPRNS